MRIYYFDTEVGALATAAISHLLEKDSQRVDELHASVFDFVLGETWKGNPIDTVDATLVSPDQVVGVYSLRIPNAGYVLDSIGSMASRKRGTSAGVL